MESPKFFKTACHFIKVREDGSLLVVDLSLKYASIGISDEYMFKDCDLKKTTEKQFLSAYYEVLSKLHNI